MDEKLKERLKDKFCLGCGKSCSLLEPTCHVGYEKMLEVKKEWEERRKDNG